MTTPNIGRLWGYEPPLPLRGVFHQSKMLGQHLGKGTGAEVVSDPPETVILEMLEVMTKSWGSYIQTDGSCWDLRENFLCPTQLLAPRFPP